MTEWAFIKCTRCGEDIPLYDVKPVVQCPKCGSKHRVDDAEPDTPLSVWIVDYDLPQSSSRRRFYRRIQAWLRDHDVVAGTGWSTQSVVVTDDKEFAEFVYAQVSQVGRAHMYKAEKIK